MAKKLFRVHPAKRSPRQVRQAEQARIRSILREEDASALDQLPDILPPPAAGKDGLGRRNHQYWNPIQTKQPPHQTTSQNLAGIYPFVADAGLGHKGPILGVDLNADTLWHFSPWDLYMDESRRSIQSNNVLVLGAYRAGKSGTIKMLTSRSIPFGRQIAVPSDSKGEWVALAEAIPGGQVLEPGLNQIMNPLDRGPRRAGISDEVHERMVLARRQTVLNSLVEATIRGETPMNPMERGVLNWALNASIEHTQDNPTLTSIYNMLTTLDPNASAESGRRHKYSERAIAILERFVVGDLSGLFEKESSVKFDAEAPIVVVNTAELFARGELIAQLTSVCTNAWIQAVISDKAAKRTWYLIREEGWRDMTSVESLSTLQQWLKLSRHYGVANILILHKVSDLDAVGEEGSKERGLAYSIMADIENKFVFRVNAQEEDNLVKYLKLPPAHARDARTLRQGVFLAYVGLYSYAVDAFATSTQWEFELFNTDDAVAAGLSSEELSDPKIYIDLDMLDRLWPTDLDEEENPAATGPWAISKSTTQQDGKQSA